MWDGPGAYYGAAITLFDLGINDVIEEWEAQQASTQDVYFFKPNLFEGYELEGV